VCRGVEWTEKAIEAFETLTYCAHWKILMARVEFNSSVNGRNVYSLKLVDTNTEKVLKSFYIFFFFAFSKNITISLQDIDIATEIVRLEFGSVITQELSM
jgi:hypothetical protein